MIQFNLLPDVKQEFVKARRTKRLVTLVSIGASALALFVLVLMILTVDVVQKKTLGDINADIKTDTAKLVAVPDLDKVLTVQNQLNTLPGLHDSKVVTSRLFGFISQVTPSSTSISQLATDFTLNTITINGQAPTIDGINAYVDTLKATTYKNDQGAATKAFSGVVLTSFSRSSTAASFTITLSFDPLIFSNTNDVTLTVPKGATGSQAQLFQKAGS